MCLLSDSIRKLQKSFAYILLQYVIQGKYILDTLKFSLNENESSLWGQYNVHLHRILKPWHPPHLYLYEGPLSHLFWIYFVPIVYFNKYNLIQPILNPGLRHHQPSRKNCIRQYCDSRQRHQFLRNLPNNNIRNHLDVCKSKCASKIWK